MIIRFAILAVLAAVGVYTFTWLLTKRGTHRATSIGSRIALSLGIGIVLALVITFFERYV